METLGPYRLDRCLGSGGMGVVHAAWDTGLDRPVALKVISPQLAHDPGFRARFVREAQVQAALDSEHVVRVYAHGEDDGRLWIASQLVPDGDLGALLRRHGAPPTPVALDLVGQVAAGLADAHAAGLVHRDIKPANVLLRRGPRIRAYLADFGIARPFGGAATGTGPVGTPRYMAPELHTGGTPGVASDVYSLGCLLWAALTGSAPYAGTSDFEIVTAHRERPVPQLPGGDPRTRAVNRVLRRAMAKRPSERYPSAAALGAELAAAAALPDVPPRRSRRGLPAAVAALVLLAGAGAWALTRPGDGAAPAADVQHRARAELARSLGSAMTAERATCAAAYLVDDLGFDRLVAAGFFAADGSFLDPDLAGRPAIKRSLRSAARSCA